ncbi:hypothetical protein [Yeosuana marina]|uniref:hypothetical protein n=1 Tax=Yeosuana marina TaxID=1565536 RepID=UPI00141D8130|nr:hypothetical protein [Yeosuana marina]
MSDENGNLKTSIIGYKTPQKIELFLKLFWKDNYKQMKSKDDYAYHVAFVPQFKQQELRAML